MAALLAAALVLALAASAAANNPCTPNTTFVFGGATSVKTLERQVVATYTKAISCYASARTYLVAASVAAMTTAQESGLGYVKYTVLQGLQSYSLLLNGTTDLTLSCQSLADLYSGYSSSIGGGAITIPVARSDSLGTSFVFSS
eukprot:SM000274S09993  [mRNA]  locus=s274:70310:70990:+ [translate_table: standard]